MHRARVQIAFSTNLSRLQLGPFSKKQKDFLLLWPQRSYVGTKWQIILQIGIPFVVSTFENRRRLKNRRNAFINAISPFFVISQNSSAFENQKNLKRSFWSFWVILKQCVNYHCPHCPHPHPRVMAGLKDVLLPSFTGGISVMLYTFLSNLLQ